MSALDSVTDRAPLMRPGRTARNAALSVAALVALLVLPVTMIAIALAVPVLLAFNVRGFRDRLGDSSLSRLPGLSHERRAILALAAFVYLLVLAGAASAVWSGFAPAANNTTAPNATTAEAQAPGIEIVNTTDANGDGRYEAFGVLVRANTSVPEGDGSPNESGEPYFAVQVNGQWRFDTSEVARDEEFSTTIPMNASTIPENTTGDLNVTVRLLERDVAFNDGIAAWSTTVPYAPAETPTPTATSTSTVTPTSTEARQSNASSGGGGGQTSPYPDQSLIKNVSIVNERDSNDDGRPEAFSLQVRANTTLPAADTDGSAGDPYFAVAVGGAWQFDTPQVRRAANGTFTIRMKESRLSSASPGRVWIRIRLMNGNTIFHDRIATQKVNIPYAPVSTPTPTATPTDTPTPTPTDTPTATDTPTPTPAPEPADTETPTPAPEQSDAGSSEGDDGGSVSGGDGASDDSESSARGPTDGTEWTVTVTEVVDGDTVKVRFPNGDVENVRLLGVDSPEVSGGVSPDEFEGIPETDAGEEHLSEWADRASTFAADQLSVDEEIRIETDSEADRRGSFDRLLVYAYHDDGQLLNRELLEEGYARLYDSEFSKRGEFADLEEQAQSDGVGLWGFDAPDTATPTPVPDGGDSSGQLAIADIQPEGDDETLTLKNTGDSSIDLSGYTVVFDDDQRYDIQDVTLGTGEALTVHTGEGSNSDSDVYAGFGRPVLNNDGDTVTAQDSSGTTVAEESYGDGG